MKVCKDNGIEVIGSVFYKTADEIKEIVKVCQENGIEITGSVFLRTAEEIKRNSRNMSKKWNKSNRDSIL